MLKMLCAAAALVLGLAPPVSAAETMVIATGVDPSFGQFYVAQVGGFFQKNGLDVTLNVGPSGSAMVPLLIGNQVNAVYAPEQAGIQNHNLDSNIVMVGEGSQAPRYNGLVARGIATMDGLKGKKIGVNSASSSQTLWLSIVKKLNLNPADYTIVEVEPPEMVAALERKDIDAFVVWEPWLTRATMSVPDSKVLMDNSTIYVSRAFFYMNEGWVKEHHDASVAFMRALVQADDFMRTHPDESAADIGKFLNMEPKFVMALMGKLDFKVRLAPDTAADMKIVEEQLKALGKLTKPVDWSNFFDASLLTSVSPNLVTLK